MLLVLTENLVADIVLSDEVAEQLLVDSCLVDNLRSDFSLESVARTGRWQTYSCIPKCASQLDSLEKDRLGFLQAQVGPHARADAHGTKARGVDLNVGKGKCLDHFCVFNLNGGWESLADGVECIALLG